MENLFLIGRWEPVDQLYVLAFGLSMVFGIVARKTAFCPLGGIADIMHSGDSGRLRMYFFAIGTAILGVTVLEAASLINLDNTRPPYRMSQLRWPGYILGGLLFGVGMTMCRGCGMKNMINLGSGNLKAVVAVLGMGLAAAYLLYVEGTFESLFLNWMIPMTPDLAELGIDRQDLGSITAYFSGVDIASLRQWIGFGLATVFVWVAVSSGDFRARVANSVGGLLIGLMIVGAFYLSGGPVGEVAQEASDFLEQPQNGMGVQSYTFIRPMGDMLYVLSNPEWYLVTFGLVMFVGVGTGSLLISITGGGFRVQWFSGVSEMARFFVGGMLVGIGGILGMGCTLGQGLAGTSTLALGSFMNLASLIVGAIIGIRAQRHFMDDHEMPG